MFAPKSSTCYVNNFKVAYESGFLQCCNLPSWGCSPQMLEPTSPKEIFTSCFPSWEHWEWLAQISMFNLVSHWKYSTSEESTRWCKRSFYWLYYIRQLTCVSHCAEQRFSFFWIWSVILFFSTCFISPSSKEVWQDPFYAKVLILITILVQPAWLLQRCTAYKHQSWN